MRDLSAADAANIIFRVSLLNTNLRKAFNLRKERLIGMRAMNRKKRTYAVILSLVMLAAALLNTVGCAMDAQAADLMKGIHAKNISGKQTDDSFIASAANFSIELFRRTTQKDESMMISPLSVMLALAMTANGADQATKTQMSGMLGGEIPLETLNEYLYSYVKTLPSEKNSKLSIANSIWFRDTEDMRVSEKFLQTNADYYGASAYKAAFDEQTVRDINNWVKDKTDGTIEKIIGNDTIDAHSMMYLINAIVFDAEWSTVYKKEKIHEGTFHAADGAKQTVEMMTSNETAYINDGKATGFVKPYKDNHYSFAAFLPAEGLSLDEYIASLTGESFVQTVKSAKTDAEGVVVTMPKFSGETEIKLNEALKAMGMTDAFGAGADFSGMVESEKIELFVNEVLHKTYISVDELGTKAGAVTSVQMTLGAAPIENRVTLDRPFVYAVIDNATNLPVFIGTVTGIEG